MPQFLINESQKQADKNLLILCVTLVVYCCDMSKYLYPQTQITFLLNNSQCLKIYMPTSLVLVVFDCIGLSLKHENFKCHKGFPLKAIDV